MPANTSPVFTLTPNIGVGKVTAALTDSAGTGNITTPTLFVVCTIGANGSFVKKVRWNPTASVAATTMTQTVGRVFASTKNSGATTGGTDTWLLGEVNLPAVSADHSTAPTNPIELMINDVFPSGYYILVSNHIVPAANTNWQAMCFAGDF